MQSLCLKLGLCVSRCSCLVSCQICTRLRGLHFSVSRSCCTSQTGLHQNAALVPSIATRWYTTPPSMPSTKSTETDLLRQLRAKLRLTGPITVAAYMKEVLTNPVAGYYMHKDVFGIDGDFITSPEISQLFGEMVAVWCISEWLKMGSPKPLQVVELGPGRGTLADDLLRVFCQFKELQTGVSLHIIEVSPHLSLIQELKLCGSQNVVNIIQDTCHSHMDLHTGTQHDSVYYKHNISKYGIPVYWYRQLQDLPREFSCFIAHEFFDALPIHKFQRTAAGWRELLIDLDECDGPHHLRWILARNPTPASLAYIQADETRDHVEVSPESGVIVQEMTSRIEADGGCAVIADYGHSGNKTDTFRAFRKHQLHDPLCEPGTADLTADVDFSYLRMQAQEKTLTFGPRDQRDFLQMLGIDVRLQKLLQNCSEEEAGDLMSGYDMLMNPEKMGQRFKFFSIFPRAMETILTKYPPAGF